MDITDQTINSALSEPTIAPFRLPTPNLPRVCSCSSAHELRSRLRLRAVFCKAAVHNPFRIEQAVIRPYRGEAPLLSWGGLELSLSPYGPRGIHSSSDGASMNRIVVRGPSKSSISATAPRLPDPSP